jgi:peptide deformylase
MVTILQTGDPILRQVAKPVALEEITSAKIKKVLKDMSTTLATCDDGVAIAAPQIGVSLRIFLIASRVLNAEDESETKELVFINPKIIKTSSKKVVLDEGCLSVRWIYGQIKRAEKVTVEAYDEKGHKFTRNGSGLMAQIFQHEIDHLNGILFTDQATGLQEVKPEANE